MDDKLFKNLIKTGTIAGIIAAVCFSVIFDEERQILESKSIMTSAAESDQYIPDNLDYSEVINAIKKEEGITEELPAPQSKAPKTITYDNVPLSENLSVDELLLNADTEVMDSVSEENNIHKMQHILSAYELYKEALKIDEENLKAMLGAGRMLTIIGKKSEARDVLMRAYATYPDNPDVHKTLGDYSFRFGEFNNAIEYYNLSLLSGNLKDYGTNIATAICYEKLGDIDNAKVYYKVSLHLNPDSEIAKQRLAIFEELEFEGYNPDSRIQEAENGEDNNFVSEEEIEKIIIETHKIK